MKLQFTKEKIGEKKIMVRFADGDFEKIKKIAENNKEGMGQVIRVIVRNYLKVAKGE